MNNHFSKNKKYYTIILSIFTLLLILVTFSAIKQQQITKSKAAINLNNGFCSLNGSCLPANTLCNPNGNGTPCCTGLTCVFNPDIPSTLSLKGVCTSNIQNTQPPTNPTLTPTTFLQATLTPVPNLPAVSYLLPDPEILNPKLKFASSPEQPPSYFSTTTSIPGFQQDGKWRIMQWKKTSLLNPNNYSRNLSTQSDPILGTPLYTYSNQVSKLNIYKNPSNQNKYVYELSSKNGEVRTGGGTNLLISSDDEDIDNNPLSQWSQLRRMDKRTVYSLKTKLKKMDIEYFNLPEKTIAQQKNAVQGNYNTSFNLMYINPTNNRKTHLFMQFRVADTRGRLTNEFFSQREQGGYIIGINTNNFLDQQDPNGPLRNFNYDLNYYLCHTINRIISRAGLQGNEANNIKNLRNWEIRSMYTGLETNNYFSNENYARARHNSLHANIEYGNVTMIIQLADLNVARYNNISSPYAICPENL